MLRKKALTVLAAAGALVLGLTACSSGSSSTGGSDSSASTGSGSGEAGGLITIIVNDPANPYWKTEGDIASATAKELGYESSVGAHKGDANTENTLIDTAISNKSVAIILDPANADGSIAAVKKADAAGIPVFLVNAEINETGLAKAQLVANNAQGAALGAQEFVKAMGEKGTYVELFGAPSDNNAQTRSNGFGTVISQYPTLTKAGQEVADWDRTKGHDKMQALMQATPTINGVLAGNDEMALGAVAALKEAGKLDGVVIGGFDGAPDAVEAVKTGEMAYTVLQPVAVYSKDAVTMADEFIRTGKAPETEKKAYDCILITKDNADKMTAPFVYEG